MSEREREANRLKQIEVKKEKKNINHSRLYIDDYRIVIYILDDFFHFTINECINRQSFLACYNYGHFFHKNMDCFIIWILKILNLKFSKLTFVVDP